MTTEVITTFATLEWAAKTHNASASLVYAALRLGNRANVGYGELLRASPADVPGIRERLLASLEAHLGDAEKAVAEMRRLVEEAKT